MSSFHLPIAFMHNHGSSPEIHMKNASMTAVIVQMAMDIERSKNRLSVRMQKVDKKDNLKNTIQKKITKILPFKRLHAVVSE